VDIPCPPRSHGDSQEVTSRADPPSSDASRTGDHVTFGAPIANRPMRARP